MVFGTPLAGGIVIAIVSAIVYRLVSSDRNDRETIADTIATTIKGCTSGTQWCSARFLRGNRENDC
jgi:hypothetical protein